MTLPQLAVLLGEDCQLSIGSASAIGEALAIHLGLSVGIMHTMCLALWFVAPRKLWRPVGLALAGASAAGALALVHAHRDSMNWLGGFLASVFGFHSFFKNLAVGTATFPEGADKDLKTWILWYTNFPEPVFVKGNIAKASLQATLQRLGLAVVKLAAMVVLLSLSPNQQNTIRVFVASDEESLSSSLVDALNNYLQLWWLYLFASFLQDIGALIVHCQGLATEAPFGNPMLLSRSYREAWGERWNRPVHVLLKRSVYKPLRRAGVSAKWSTAGTFVASGLLHEYTFYLHNYQGYRCGRAMVFFWFMGLLMSLEAALEGPVWMRKALKAVPSPLIALVIQIPVVFLFVPFFFASWANSGHVEEMRVLFSHWVCPINNQ